VNLRCGAGDQDISTITIGALLPGTMRPVSSSGRSVRRDKPACRTVQILICLESLDSWGPVLRADLIAIGSRFVCSSVLRRLRPLTRFDDRSGRLKEPPATRRDRLPFGRESGTVPKQDRPTAGQTNALRVGFRSAFVRRDLSALRSTGRPPSVHSTSSPPTRAAAAASSKVARRCWNVGLEPRYSCRRSCHKW
jgi:hypothetical protein